MADRAVQLIVGGAVLARVARRGHGRLRRAACAGRRAGRRQGDRRDRVDRRLVAQCAWNAARTVAAGLAGVARLLAANRRAARRLVGPVFFIGVLDHRKINLCRHLRMHVGRSHERLQDGLDAPDIALLDFLRVFQLAHIQAARARIGR